MHAVLSWYVPLSSHPRIIASQFSSCFSKLEFPITMTIALKIRRKKISKFEEMLLDWLFWLKLPCTWHGHIDSFWTFHKTQSFVYIDSGCIMTCSNSRYQYDLSFQSCINKNIPNMLFISNSKEYLSILNRNTFNIEINLILTLEIFNCTNCDAGPICMTLLKCT